MKKILDYFTYNGKKNSDDTNKDIEINQHYIPSNTFKDCCFKNSIYLSSQNIEKNAFINCVFEEKLTLMFHYPMEIFNNCKFLKGTYYLNINENKHKHHFDEIEIVPIQKKLENIRIENIQTENKENIYFNQLKLDIIPTGAIRNKRFINNINIIANEVCMMAFENCDFENDVTLNINTHEGNIFQDCVFKKKIIFNSISHDDEIKKEKEKEKENDIDDINTQKIVSSIDQNNYQHFISIFYNHKNNY